MIEVDRRRALISAAGLVVGGMTTARLLPEEMLLRDRRLARSKVAIISAGMYSEGLVDSLTRALSIFGLNLRHKSVLLKPNHVEYIAGVEVNTNPVLVGAAARGISEAGRRQRRGRERVLGTSATRIWCSPRADSKLNYAARRSAFVDLNRDELFKVPTRANYTGSRSSVAASDSTHVRLRGVDAEDQNAPLGWRYA